MIEGRNFFFRLVLASGLFSFPARSEVLGDPFLPLPLKLEIKKDLADLGEKLFADRRLSRDQNLSCASCHDLAAAGIDPRERVDMRSDRFNTPTLFNVAYNFKYFWNGRADTLEEQIELTIRSTTVFNNDWTRIEDRLKNDPVYQPLLDRLGVGSKLKGPLIKKALVEFERSLWTPNSRFDRFLRGEEQALTDSEKQGYLLFKSLGCSSCHQGMLLGGNMFQKFGVFSSYVPAKPFAPRDLGRFSITQREEERSVFKVPSLRNVELTAPYLHNGAILSLPEVVSVMSRVQLGRELADKERDHIVEFLRTLTGEWRGQKLR